MKKISSPGKILLGMIIGVIIGLVMEQLPTEWLMFKITANTAEVFGAVFLNAFQMIVGPVVFVSLVLGVMNMNNPAILGRVGLKTIAMYFITTILAIGCGLLVAWFLTPGAGVDLSRVSGGAKYQVPALEQVSSFADVLINIVPKNIIRAFADNLMLQIIFVAILCGIALAVLGDEIKQLKHLVEEFNLLNIKIIDLIMKFAPIGVCALMVSTFAKFGYEALLPLLMYIVCVALAMLLLVLAAYAPMLKFYVGISPWHFLKKFFPVVVLGFSTSSSNAALPLNIEVLIKKIGVSEKLATLILSLGATLNMNGTAIMQGVGALFIAQLYHIDLTIGAIISVVFTAVVASMGTAGVPGAGIIMLAMVLQSAGLPLEGIAVLMGVDRLIDMMRTAINIAGDAICTCVIAKNERELNKDIFIADV